MQLTRDSDRPRASTVYRAYRRTHAADVEVGDVIRLWAGAPTVKVVQVLAAVEHWLVLEGADGERRRVKAGETMEVWRRS